MLPHTDPYMLSSFQPVPVALRNSPSRVSTAIRVYNFYQKQIFGMPDRAPTLYTADKLGCYREPHLDSNVKPEKRIDVNFLVSGFEEIPFKPRHGSVLPLIS